MLEVGSLELSRGSVMVVLADVRIASSKRDTTKGRLMKGSNQFIRIRVTLRPFTHAVHFWGEDDEQ